MSEAAQPVSFLRGKGKYWFWVYIGILVLSILPADAISLLCAVGLILVYFFFGRNHIARSLKYVLIILAALQLASLAIFFIEAASGAPAAAGSPLDTVAQYLGIAIMADYIVLATLTVFHPLANNLLKAASAAVFAAVVLLVVSPALLLAKMNSDASNLTAAILQLVEQLAMIFYFAATAFSRPRKPKPPETLEGDGKALEDGNP